MNHLYPERKRSNKTQKLRRKNERKKLNKNSQIMLNMCMYVRISIIKFLSLITKRIVL